MARLSRKPILDKGLLKQSVLNANKKLQSAQKALSKDLSSRKDYLASIDKAIKAAKKELASTQKELKTHATEFKNLVLEKSVIAPEIKKLNAKVSKLSSEENALSLSCIKLQKKIDKYKAQNNQLTSLAGDIKQATGVLKNLDAEKATCITSLDKLKTATSKLKGRYDKQDNERKALHKEMCAQMDGEAKKYAEEGYKLREKAKKLKEKLKADIRENNTNVGNLATEIKAAKKQAEDDLMDGRGQLMALKSEINRHGTALSKGLIELNDLKVKVSLEEKKIEDVKRAFEAFKVKAFEEVATLKLRKRIEKIDKAGLSEVFNR
jgi:chromosome segregation ATPase